jgi:hypothetical protein
MKFLPLVFLLLLSCGKDDKKDYPNHECVTGFHKTRQVREKIGCWHREMINCGTNQACADKVAEKYGIPKRNVEILVNYTQLQYEKNEDCNCPTP